jgi:transposase-like protein
MPFKETCRMEERIRMLSEYDTGNWSISDLCRRYGVCRDTFHEWRKRREGDTAEWFMDHSHAPLHCPHRTEAAISEAVISLRRRFPHLGPRKLRVVLERQAPETCWPAASTIGDILKQAGLITPVKRRRRALDGRRSVTAVRAANEEWAADFKGWFRTRDNSRIDPLTLTDSHSRYLIEVRIVPPTIDRSQPVFAAAFRRQGLPSAIRCDNGSPFGSTGAGGLTRLSAWWIKLGIEPHFIHPALYGAFFVKRFRSGASFFLDRFLCSTWSPVSSPRPAVLQSRRAQELSRLAVAPTLRRTPPLPGHTLTASSTTTRLVRSG